MIIINVIIGLKPDLFLKLVYKILFRNPEI